MIMEDIRKTMPGQSLPGIHAITEQLFPCSRPGCTTYASNQQALVQHERSCRGSPEMAHKHPSLAASQMNRCLSQPYRLQTQFNSHSSASSVDGDSDGSSSIVMTPDVSRAPSLCSYPTSRRQSGVIRTEKGRGRKSVSTMNGLDTNIHQFDEVEKRTKKMNKEKANRGDQSAVMQRYEDFLFCYTGWGREEQSGGNGNGAGLKANKITLLHGEEALLYHLLHERRLLAIQEDRVAEFEAEMRSVLDEGTTPGRDPFAGTFLTGGPDTCCHEEKSKSCKEHGHPDWRDCRLQHRHARMETNQKSYIGEQWAKLKQGAKALPRRMAHAFSSGRQ